MDEEPQVFRYGTRAFATHLFVFVLFVPALTWGIYDMRGSLAVSAVFLALAALTAWLLIRRILYMARTVVVVDRESITWQGDGADRRVLWSDVRDVGPANVGTGGGRSKLELGKGEGIILDPSLERYKELCQLARDRVRPW